MSNRWRYKPEHLEYLRKIAPSNTNDDIVRKFNVKFSLNKSKPSLNEFRRRNGIKVGKQNNKGQYKKGHIPWCKTAKGKDITGKGGRIKGGKEHFNYREIGTEIVDYYGYVTVKIADPDVWKRKHRIVWEKHHGEVEKGHVIIFADSNKLNCSIENLICLSKGQHTRLHRNGLCFEDAELTKTGVNIVKLQEKIAELQ